MTALKVRVIYLLMFMAFAVWRVFYNIYLDSIGLDGSQIGTINAIMQSSIFIVVAIWGVYADKRGIRPILRIAVIGTAMAIGVLGYVTNFWWLLVFIPIVTFFYHPLAPLTDALAIKFSMVEGKHSYGSFRLWGSLGWAIASMAGGYLFLHIDIFYLFPISAVLFLLVLPSLSTKKKKHTFTANFEKLTFKQVLRNKPLIYFLSIISLYGIVCSPINTYLNLYFKELNGDNSTVGLAYAIMAFSELPLFLIGNHLLKKMGAKTVIYIAMITMAGRYFIYGSNPDIYVALAVGLLQGISFAFFLVGAVDYIGRLVPASQLATGQSLIWGSYAGIGQTVGNLVIGFLMDITSLVGVMKLSAWAALACFALTILYFKRYKPSLATTE